MSLKIRKKSTIAWILFRNRQNVDFQRVFNDSMWLESLTNLKARSDKRSVVKWALSFHKVSSKTFCFTLMPGRQEFGHKIPMK